MNPPEKYRIVIKFDQQFEMKPHVIKRCVQSDIYKILSKGKKAVKCTMMFVQDGDDFVKNLITVVAILIINIFRDLQTHYTGINDSQLHNNN